MGRLTRRGSQRTWKCALRLDEHPPWGKGLSSREVNHNIVVESRDPNEGSTDPMVPEHWRLGEDLQDRIRDAGYDSDTVEGIAVDVHDLMQACDRIRDEIIPAALAASTADLTAHVKQLQFELSHIRWHATAGEAHLQRALAVLEPRNEQPL